MTLVFYFLIGTERNKLDSSRRCHTITEPLQELEILMETGNSSVKLKNWKVGVEAGAEADRKFTIWVGGGEEKQIYGNNRT